MACVLVFFFALRFEAFALERVCASIEQLSLVGLRHSNELSLGSVVSSSLELTSCMV